ncbi:hypothetical protein SEPCBS119000_002858 [Sporothrix epigloea]|uniref:Lipase 1 n=1 Tax=Sporothrix epigloea TaxID=1892477 RepID=A0ABP0DK85_9PEZI
MRTVPVLLAAVSLASHAAAAPSSFYGKRAALVDSSSAASTCNTTDQPIPPSQDPWYTAPYEFAHEAPGTILRVRPAPGNLSTIAGNCSAAYNILYRTTGSLYDPTWAVTTLFIPKSMSHSNSTTNSTKNSTQGSLLSYQIPYDAVFVDASPSYALYGGVDADIGTALGKGWFVNVPDFEGNNASFTAGVLSGHATLDSIRAVLNGAHRFGLPPQTKYAMWGYSGGALASEWAAELQVQYAPELNISGAALGGLTPNVTSVLFTIYDGVEAGLAPPAILGLTNQYPEVYDSVVSKLKKTGPYNATGFLATLNYTLDDNISKFALKNMSMYFDGGLDDLVSPTSLRIINRDGVMGYHGVPQMPLFVYKAVGDEISPINDTDALVERFCGVGVNINYQRNSIGGHVAEGTNGIPAATAWLDSIFDGSFASSANATGCFISNVSVNVTDSGF